MAITVSKIQQSDPQYVDGVVAFRVAGTFDVGNVPGLSLPMVITAAQAQALLADVQRLQRAMAARYDSSIAALGQIVTAIQG